MTYAEIAAINVNEHVEKKQGLSYLSWAYAVDTLLRLDPTAKWEYGEPVRFGDTLMVFCTVTAFGSARMAQLPVMDHRNKAIANPDAFAVNTAMQRCLAKAIALHGLGLYIYAGEDLPIGDAEPKEEKPRDEVPKAQIDAAIADMMAAAEDGMESLTAAWKELPAPVRKAVMEAGGMVEPKKIAQANDVRNTAEHA